MRPAAFDYVVPGSLAEACAALAGDPHGSRVLAGGQSLVPRLVRRIERPRRLVDVSALVELRGLTATPEGLTIGAAVTQREAELSPLTDGFGVLAQALPRVGKVTTRNRGTVCGSLAHANPAAELGVCLVAMGGELRATSAAGSRAIDAQAFFLAPFRTALRDGELLESATFARPAPGAAGAFDEVTLRGAGDTPLVSAAVVCAPGGDGLAGARIAVGGAGAAPRLAEPRLTAPLADPGDGQIDAVAGAVAAGLGFASDGHASAEHRARLAAALVGRLLRRVREARR
jgi:CO/xanthine dehydrogenase FAD-binding subunit